MAFWGGGVKRNVDTFIGNVRKEGYNNPKKSSACSGITHADFHTEKETFVENDSLERDIFIIHDQSPEFQIQKFRQ